jgi:hypothetical protein
MTSNTQNCFALLVGVNGYLNNNSRRHPNGDAVTLRNLQGAVNDVDNIRTILQNKFNLNQLIPLTSSPSSADSCVLEEPEERWPTHTNIKKAFDEIYNKATPGDVFFFYFAGHGALLCTTAFSPVDGRNKDPALITADYCCGQPAIRGWELNEWLWRFHEKGIRVVVLVDSCYSGGAWRNDKLFRSPENWTPPPNLPSDEAVVQATQKKPGHRDGDLGISWDINPRGFTLMAACQSTEMAAERTEGQAAYGAFTLALQAHLQDPSNTSFSTYRIVRDAVARQLVSWGLSQKPQVFGRDRLAFFEDYEPFMATPIAGTVQGNLVSLPAGKIHGITEGMEFLTTSTGSKAVVSISEIQDYKSTARITKGSLGPLGSVEIIPFRWSTNETLEVAVDSNLGLEFQEHLVIVLGERIAGNIRYSEGLPSTNDRAPWCVLRKGEVGIDIFGQGQLTGNSGPVRGWKNTGKTNEEKARESAIALTHLFRFGQILHLRNETGDSAPFEAVLQQTDNTDVHKFRYTFRN